MIQFLITIQILNNSKLFFQLIFFMHQTSKKFVIFMNWFLKVMRFCLVNCLLIFLQIRTIRSIKLISTISDLLLHFIYWFSRNVKFWRGNIVEIVGVVHFLNVFKLRYNIERWISNILDSQKTCSLTFNTHEQITLFFPLSKICKSHWFLEKLVHYLLVLI